MPFAKSLRARSGGRFLLLPPSERHTSSIALWTLTGFDSPGTFFQKFTPPISANLSRPDRPAARLQESFQLCVRNMGTFCLNGNTTELRLPAMHYSASRPLSQADRKRSQMERFEDADRQGGRSEAQTNFTSGHPEAASQQSKEKSVKVQRRFRKFYQRLDGDTTFLAAALFPFSLHSRINECGFHEAVQQSISSQVGMIHSLLGLKAKTFNMKQKKNSTNN